MTKLVFEITSDEELMDELNNIAEELEAVSYAIEKGEKVPYRVIDELVNNLQDVRKYMYKAHK